MCLICLLSIQRQSPGTNTPYPSPLPLFSPLPCSFPFFLSLYLLSLSLIPAFCPFGGLGVS